MTYFAPIIIGQGKATMHDLSGFLDGALSAGRHVSPDGRFLVAEFVADRLKGIYDAKGNDVEAAWGDATCERFAASIGLRWSPRNRIYPDGSWT